MNKINLCGYISNGGDGSAGIQWYLTREEMEILYDWDIERGENFAECCWEEIESFEGSKQHMEAIKNSNQLKEDRK